MHRSDQLLTYIRSLDGYKIQDTHFRIGSKIHAGDFYYAKRLFQNSYYTARIALLLALKIKEKIQNKSFNITLVGYEMYSELLLSLIKNILIDYGYKTTNHFVTLDTDDTMTHLPFDIQLGSTIAIIVPITSTGSTSSKIESYVKSLKNDITQILHFNVLQASDRKFDSINQQDQDTLIHLATTWESPSNCKWCFDNQYSKPLFETDKSSLTPFLIFSLPLSKNIDPNDISVPFNKVNFESSLIYRQAKRNNEHFLYSTKTDLLIESNITSIQKWLSKVKENLNLKSTDKIIIISPCHYTNMRFIHLVNEQVFNSSATIIHHQTDVDYPSNFKLLNQTYLTQDNCKIFFVDDSLISGTNFFKIYDLYRFTSNYDDNKNTKLSGVICLSNKTSSDIHKRISRTVQNLTSDNINSPNFFSFVNINVPISHKVFGNNPLSHEVNRYKEISLIALHDVPKTYYSNKAKNINGENFTDENDTRINDEGYRRTARHLKMFKLTHNIYDYFSNNLDVRASNTFRILDLQKKCCDSDTNEDKIALLKVLSQYPFLLYKPIRRNVFDWHKVWLTTKTEAIDSDLNNEINTLTYDSLSELKFLIRRSVFINNYYITNEFIFRLISKIFILIDKSKTENKTSTELIASGDLNFWGNLDKNQIENLNDLHIFLLYQYIEIVNKNSWCAAEIMKSIKNTKDSFSTKQGKQFIRMLKIEASCVLNDFYELLKHDKKWQSLYRNQGYKNIDKLDIDLNNNKIKEYLSASHEKLQTNKFEIANTALSLKKDPVNLKDTFLNYLWVKQFLDTDRNNHIGDISLTEKTESIFKKLKGYFTKPDEIGAFFIVTDGKNNPHLVYDKDKSGNRYLIDINNKYTILNSFLKGVPDEQNIAFKTIIEFARNDSGSWEDMYSLEKIPNKIEFEKKDNWLLLIRLSSLKRKVIKKNNSTHTSETYSITEKNFETLGLIGFYGSEINQDELSKELLMLTRNDLGEFIQRHHKNDEFYGLREAETVKRFAYLAGHGRQMMQELASRDSQTFSNVVSTMEKLQYLFATRLITGRGYSGEAKKMNEQILFKNIFHGNTLDVNSINEIINIGNKVFESEIIENSIQFKQLPAYTDNAFRFHFNSDILEFICFELFVNAKKNRFHFISDSCNKCYIKENCFKILFKIIDKRLHIELSGTGPKIDLEIENRINSGLDVKPDFEIAGLKLIREVITNLDPNNEIKINTTSIIKKEDNPENIKCEFCGIYSNTVSLSLHQMI